MPETEQGYPTFTRLVMPWQRSLPNSTILLSYDNGSPMCALTPAAAEDLAASLLEHARNVRAGHVPPSPVTASAPEGARDA